MPRTIVLGTNNQKKRLEMEQLLEPLGVELKTLSDFANSLDVPETGTTFAENARLKATVQALHLKHWVLAEDSGLSVAALDGRPGVYSARYSDPGANDERNNQKLLDEFADVRLDRRSAHYTCHLALSDSAGQVRLEVEDYCHGRIVFEPCGTAGFGYDPLFEIVEYHRTFGQLGEAVKSILSHRSRAIRRLLPLLPPLRG